MTWPLIFKFIGLLPEFWSQFKIWQAVAEEKSYQKYVEDREKVIQMLAGVKDAKSAFETALACQSLLHSGK